MFPSVAISEPASVATKYLSTLVLLVVAMAALIDLRIQLLIFMFLDCSRFPRDSRERLCVDGNADDLPDPSSHLDWPNTKPQGTLSPLPTFPGAGMQFECPAHLQVEPAREYKIYIGNKLIGLEVSWVWED